MSNIYLRFSNMNVLEMQAGCAFWAIVVVFATSYAAGDLVLYSMEEVLQGITTAPKSKLKMISRTS